MPLAKQAGTSGIIVVTSSTHQGRADEDFVDAGAYLLATVSYPDGNPSLNVAQVARDAGASTGVMRESHWSSI